MSIKLSGMVSNMDTDSIVKELVSAYNVKVENVQKQKTKLEWKSDAWKELNTKIYSFYSTELSNLRLSSSYKLKTASISDTSVAKVTATSNAVNGTQSLAVEQLAKSGYLTGSELSTVDASALSSATTLGQLGYASGPTALTLHVDGVDKGILVSEATTVSSFVSSLKNAGVTASFDATNKRLFISSTSTGAASDFTISASDASGTNALQALGISTGVKVNGQDAKIVLNGATFTSSNNSFTINGVSISVTATTENDLGGFDEVSITTDTDNQGIYDKIKNFLYKYNDLIKEMDTLYNASSAKGYEPLTDEEKDAMSETQIDKWESKIKDSLLRRDATLGSINSLFKGDMAAEYTINGKKLSLSTFGIKTANYFLTSIEEKGVFHIDGNKEDATTSGNTDKLMTAINEDPEMVVDFFASLTSSLYHKLSDQMKGTVLHSTYTVYNDKQMAKDLDDYEEKIDLLQEKVEDMENRYYNQFSAMETALANLQTSQSALSSLLGTSS